MIKSYGKKVIKFEFNFDDNGESLKTIINKSYKEELYKNKFLLGHVKNINTIKKGEI